jgi:hypothetical protein
MDAEDGLALGVRSTHALIHSLKPSEEWRWRFVDETGILSREIQGHTGISPSQNGGQIATELHGVVRATVRVGPCLLDFS